MDDNPGDIPRNKALWWLLKTKSNEKVGYYKKGIKNPSSWVCYAFFIEPDFYYMEDLICK